MMLNGMIQEGGYAGCNMEFVWGIKYAADSKSESNFYIIRFYQGSLNIYVSGK